MSAKHIRHSGRIEREMTDAPVRHNFFQLVLLAANTVLLNKLLLVMLTICLSVTIFHIFMPQCVIGVPYAWPRSHNVTQNNTTRLEPAAYLDVLTGLRTHFRVPLPSCILTPFFFTVAACRNNMNCRNVWPTWPCSR